MTEINYNQEYINTQQLTIQELITHTVKLRTDITVLNKTMEGLNERNKKLEKIVQDLQDNNTELKSKLEQSDKTISTQSDQLRQFNSIKNKADEAGGLMEEVRNLKQQLEERDNEIEIIKNPPKTPRKRRKKETLLPEEKKEDLYISVDPIKTFDIRDGGEF